MLKSIRDYKKAVKYQKKKYHKELVDKLDRTHESEPSEYWKM
jgi:hypothetical protein